MLWIEAKEILLVYKTTKVQTTYWGELCEVGKTILGTTTTKGILIIICPSFVFCQWETWIVEIWNSTLVVSHSHTAKEQKQFQLIALASILCKLGDCNPFPPNFWHSALSVGEGCSFLPLSAILGNWGACWPPARAWVEDTMLTKSTHSLGLWILNTESRTKPSSRMKLSHLSRGKLTSLSVKFSSWIPGATLFFAPCESVSFAFPYIFKLSHIMHIYLFLNIFLKFFV